MTGHREKESSASQALWPLAGVRTQLVAGAVMWLIGGGILLVRGAGYIQGRSWQTWALAAGLALGLIKSRYLLEGVAEHAVERISKRGRAWLPSFFSLRSWGLVALMMGSGMALRALVSAPDQIAAAILGAICIGVGAALLLACRIFWHAVFGRSRNGAVTG